MKSIKLTVACAAALMAVASACHNEKKDTNIIPLSEAEELFASQLTQTDTLSMLEMGDALMDSLQAGNIDYFCDALMTVADGSVRGLNDQEKAGLHSRFERFPVLSWSRDHYDMSIPSINDLKYRYVYNDKGNTMTIMFNPVKREEGWIMMLKQANQPAKDAANRANPDTPVNMPVKQEGEQTEE